MSLVSGVHQVSAPCQVVGLENSGLHVSDALLEAAEKVLGVCVQAAGCKLVHYLEGADLQDVFVEVLDISQEDGCPLVPVYCVQQVPFYFPLDGCKSGGDGK